jgi:hypothetical protein
MTVPLLLQVYPVTAVQHLPSLSQFRLATIPDMIFESVCQELLIKSRITRGKGEGRIIDR